MSPARRARLVCELGEAIQGNGFPEVDASNLADEIVELVHDRGAGDIGDIRAAIKRLAVHFPRTSAAEVQR
jgi:hypothetical protein